MVSERTRAWFRANLPLLGVVALIALSNGVYVLSLHREGSKDDAPPLAMPTHYILQRPHTGRFEESCLARGWATLSPAIAASFAPGVDRERLLGVLRVGDGERPAQLRVSLREPAPFPAVLQIEFVGTSPASADHPLVLKAKRVLTVLDDACDVPYVAPSECGSLSRAVCRAFSRR